MRFKIGQVLGSSSETINKTDHKPIILLSLIGKAGVWWELASCYNSYELRVKTLEFRIFSWNESLDRNCYGLVPRCLSFTYYRELP